MKIIQGSASARVGGAARAALRLHQALRSLEIDSTMLTLDAECEHAGVVTVGDRRPELKYGKLWLESALLRLTSTPDPSLRSVAVFNGPVGRRMLRSDADIFHLHWLGAQAASVRQIGKLLSTGRVVWTLHDLWVISGSEHYATSPKRRNNSYSRDTRSTKESGIDVNRQLWEMKRRHWNTPAHLVAPSHWLATQLEQSSLCSTWPIQVIPNAIDTTVFRPIDQALARDLLDIPTDTPVLLFGALGGTGDPRKGWDLLQSSLPQVLRRCPDLHLMVLGGLHGAIENVPSERIIDLGQLADDPTLTLAYNASDCVVVPSRLDVLPQVATEAQACGTPVIAFRTSGLTDCVEDHKTGYLAEPFSPDDLAECIGALLEDDQTRSTMAKNARSRALALWSRPVVAEKYQNIYQAVLDAL